jgi:Terpene synthase family 2, C-terminal metal binding
LADRIITRAGRRRGFPRCRDWKLAEAAAFFYPDATPEGLDLAADLMGWYFPPFDDQFDGELGRDPRRAAEICAHLIAILNLSEGAQLPASYPVTAGFANLWWRSCRGMSNDWRQRAAHHWKKYLTGQLGEVVNRCYGRILDAVSCLRQRIATTSMWFWSPLVPQPFQDRLAKLRSLAWSSSRLAITTSGLSTSIDHSG